MRQIGFIYVGNYEIVSILSELILSALPNFFGFAVGTQHMKVY